MLNDGGSSFMKIIVGSKNQAKYEAVLETFPKAEVKTRDVDSEISAQPFSDVETMRGAINRAQNARLLEQNTVGIGLEGGVMDVDGHLFLCNWGALVTENHKVYTASGARIKLPQEIAMGLKSGKELGDLMDEYAHKLAVRQHEGAIGIFTNDRISRKVMFAHVVLLLRGQWEYWDKNK